jgi:hypothetical protein
MASKRRPPISFPELEPKGRGAILRSPEEIRAEQQLLQRQDAGDPAIQYAGMPESQNASLLACRRVRLRTDARSFRRRPIA